MKKIYSFVLMAAMLLVGANVWATTIEVDEISDLQTYLSAAANDDVIKLTMALDEPQFDGQLVLNANKHITLDLNGKELVMNNTSAAKNAAIEIRQGRLEIINGKISNLSNGANYTSDLIRVYGYSTNETIDVSNDNVVPYSQVIVRENATLWNNVTKSGAKFNVLTIFESGTANLANGARIDVYGKLKASTYGIKVNGNVAIPNPTTNSPFVYIHEGAMVESAPTSSGAVAAYSSGYARWLIKGYCGGSTGLYVKSGSVVLEDAVVASTNTSAVAPVGQGSGVTAGGSAIVMESNSSYQGNMSVTITGNTEVSATAGYAIEETITTAPDTEVEMIKIESGVISGGNKGAIIIEDKTAQQPKEGGQPGEKETTGKVVIVGGNVGGDIVVDQTSAQGEQDQPGPRELLEISVAQLGGYVELPSTQTATPTAVEVDGKSVIVFVPAGTDSYAVTLNDEYLATFSAEKAVTIPAGLKAYAAGEMVNNELALTPISDGTADVNISAGTAVILYNAAKNKKNYDLEVTASNELTDGPSTNSLKPALAWHPTYAGSAYILHGSELYLYNGVQMAANKAFLKFPGADPSSAPQRIRMVFHETEQATEIGNLEVVSVKAVKFVENGEILIRRGENVYNLQGQIVK